MKKKEKPEAGLIPNPSINVELSQSDLISVIISDQVSEWETKLEEANAALNKFDSEFHPNSLITQGLKRIISEKCGVYGGLEISGIPNYQNFLIEEKGYPLNIGASTNVNGIQIHVSYQIPFPIIISDMKSEIKVLKDKLEERKKILNEIISLQENIDNQSRYESKIRSNIAKRILADQGNTDLLNNLENMRKSIFSDKKLLG